MPMTLMMVNAPERGAGGISAVTRSDPLDTPINMQVVIMRKKMDRGAAASLTASHESKLSFRSSEQAAASRYQ